MGCEVMCNWCD